MRRPPFMQCQPLLLVLCGWGLSAVAHDPVQSGASRMVLEASSASLGGGRARLTTTALRRKAGSYVGNYQIKVFPYAFKNETGTLAIGVSDDAVRALFSGKTVQFSGRAVTSATGKSRAVAVVATPAAAGLPKGKLTITITTENGPLIFAPAYALTGG